MVAHRRRKRLLASAVFIGWGVIKSLKMTLKKSQYIDVVIILSIILLILISLRSLFVPGLFYAHDSLYHFVRQYHYSHELARGQFPVRMATGLAYGQGYPIFNFVYSLPYAIGNIGGILHLSYVDSLKAVVCISSLLSVAIWYVWLRRNFSRYASALGTVFFWFFPYRFLTYFVTFQFGAIVANSFFPLLLLGLDSVLSEMKIKNCGKLLGFAAAVISLTGMILSHLVTLLIYLPFLVVYVGYSLRHALFKKIVPLVWILILSTGISAYYWLPATVELSWIKAGQQAIVEYKDHFPTLRQLIIPSWGYGYSEAGSNDGISFQIGIAQWLVFVFSLIISISVILKKKIITGNLLNKKLLFIGILSFCMYLILLLPISNTIWEIMPLIKSIQHPWRLLAGVGASASLLLTVLAHEKWGKILALLFVLLAIFNTRNYQRPMSFEYLTDAELIQKVENAESGDVSWEFLPIWAEQPTSFSENFVLQWRGDIVSQFVDGMSTQLISEKEEELVLNKIYYPSWVLIDGDERISTYPSETGMLAATLPAGQHALTLQLGETTAAKMGNSISMISVGVFILVLIGESKFFHLVTHRLNIFYKSQ